MFGIKILLIKAGKGALGCGYINMAAAEKFNHALAIVSGVASYEDMLAAEVKSCLAIFFTENLAISPATTPITAPNRV